MLKSCYIHIPFCDNICSYCDFPKIFYKKDIVDKYLDALDKEITNFYQGDILDTIYIGGGTPSSLSLEQLNKLFRILDKLNKSKNIEYTIEGNFDSINKEKLNLYKKYGVNRLSFGLESIDSNNLELLDRVVDKNKVINIINYSKKIGLNNINVDLIYAIPGETISILENDLSFILELDVPHISTYSLIIEDHTKLKVNKILNISEDLDYKMYKIICNKLKNNNYIHYEISNFAKRGYESYHNTNYWNNNEYYGFGLGASSYLNNIRSTNTRSINKYLNNDYSKDFEYLSKKDIMEYEVILNLRKKDGINLLIFYNKYNIELINVYDYSSLLLDKLLVLDENNLHICEDKWYISNEIIVRLLGCEVK